MLDFPSYRIFTQILLSHVFKVTWLKKQQQNQKNVTKLVRMLVL